MNVGDHVLAGGKRGRVIEVVRLPDTWTYRRPDPPQWCVKVAFPDGTAASFLARDVKPKPRD